MPTLGEKLREGLGADAEAYMQEILDKLTKLKGAVDNIPSARPLNSVQRLNDATSIITMTLTRLRRDLDLQVN